MPHPELSVDQADQLAAIAAGIQSLSHGASIEFGDGTGGVRSAMAEFYGGLLFIVEAARARTSRSSPPRTPTRASSATTCPNWSSS